MSLRRTTPSHSGQTPTRPNRRLATTAALAAAIALFTFTSKSQASIVYSGVVNVTGAVSSSVYTDFEAGITQNTFTPGWDVAISLGNILPGPEVELSGNVPSFHAVNLNELVGPGFIVSKLDAGVTIGSASAFTSSSQPGFTMADSVNNFYPWNTGATGEFVGVEFMAADTTIHYAWERLNVNATTLVPTVVDWAYESTPDTAIVTGDTGTPVPEPATAASLGLLALAALTRRSPRRKST